jgi:hypothetical protein
MGTILLWDSSSAFSSGLSWKQQWREVFQQAVNDTTPSQSCDANQTTSFIQTNIKGACRVLNNQAGCCTSTPEITPVIATASCPSRCVNLYAAYWCTVSCQGNFNLQNGTATLCSAAVQEMLDNCRDCSPALLPFNSPNAFQDGVFIRVGTDANCKNFAAVASPTELEPPTIVSLSVSNNGVTTITGPNPLVVTLSALIKNTQIPYGGRAACVTPQGEQGAVKILTSNDFERQGNGDWKVLVSCTFGPKAQKGTWNFFLRVANTNSSVVSDSAANTKFDVNSNFPPANGVFGDLDLCANGSPDSTGVSIISFVAGQSAGKINCCSSTSTCVISGTVSTIGQINGGPTPIALTGFVGSIGIVNLLLGSAGLFLTGGSSITITGVFTCASTVFGSDSSALNFGPTSSLEVQPGCEFDVTTIKMNFGPGVVAKINSAGVPGSAAKPTFEIQQSKAGGGATTFTVPLFVGPNSFIIFNGAAGALLAVLDGGLKLNDPSNAGNANIQVIIDGGVIFGNMQTGCILTLGQVAVTELPTIKRATTQPTAGDAARIICALEPAAAAVGNAVAVNAIAIATPGTRFFIQPKVQGTADCSLVLTYSLAGANPAEAWTVNAYFGQEQNQAGLPPVGLGTVPYPALPAFTRLRLQNNARIVIINVRQNGPITVVSGALDFQAGSTIEVELAQQNIATTAFEIPLIRYTASQRCVLAPASCGTDQCDVSATLVVSNPLLNRQANLICRKYKPAAAVATGYLELVLQFPAAPINAPPSAAVLPFISDIQGNILMDRTATDYPVDKFLAAILNILGITPSEIVVDSYLSVDATRRAGSRIRALFHCLSSVSLQEANSKCNRIVNEAGRQGSALNNELRAISASTTNDNTPKKNHSDSALYGLFALAAIPIIIIVLCCLFLKNRKRSADNQYMQDTATFSNVAAQPQPINNPYPYYDPGLPAQAAYDGKAPILPPPAPYGYGY